MSAATPLIALDAGHHLGNPKGIWPQLLPPGAQYAAAQLREWTLNDRICRHVAGRLERYECRTMRTDDATGTNNVSLAERNRRANDAKAAYLISVHHNGGIKGGTGGGIVVYVRQNADAESKRLQKALYDETAGRTGLKGNRAAPLAASNLAILTGAKQPAVLGEFGFMDSQTDVPAIITDKFAGQAADGIVAALVKVASLKETKGDNTDGGEDEMTIAEIKKIVREVMDEENPLYKDLKDVPGYWQGDVQALLDSGAIDGGTPAHVSATDVNTRRETLKAAVIAMRHMRAAGK